MDDLSETSRWELPLLAVGQMQKEVTHNEALARIDALLIPVVEGPPQNNPPATPQAGQCWLVGAAPVGAWTGQAQALAAWTSGGWRIIKPRNRMTVRLADGRAAIFANGQWSLPGTVAGPVGGATIDSEARASINAVISALQAQGWLTTTP